MLLREPLCLSGSAGEDSRERLGVVQVVGVLVPDTSTAHARRRERVCLLDGSDARDVHSREIHPLAAAEFLEERPLGAGLMVRLEAELRHLCF